MITALRYRCWLAYSNRVPFNEVPNDIYGAAYLRESTTLFNDWIANAYRNFKQDPNAALPYHGHPDHEFDTWLAHIYPPTA